MLKYQKILNGFKKRICSSINLAKSDKNFNYPRNLLEISSKLALVSGGLCSVNYSEATTQESGDLIGTFEIGPLEMGQGVTLGSTLRRAVLGVITGSAVTGFKVNGALHEFSAVSNIKEDMLDIASNLKLLRISCGAIASSILGQTWVVGPKIITAGMLQFPKDTATILNPSQYVCTISTGVVRLDIEVSSASGYKKVLEQRKKSELDLFNSTHKIRATNNSPHEMESTNQILMPIDANFTPIRTVSYKVKLGHDVHGTLSDTIEFTIATNGAISPKRALLEGAKEIMRLFYPLIIEPQLISAVSNNSQD